MILSVSDSQPAAVSYLERLWSSSTNSEKVEYIYIYVCVCVCVLHELQHWNLLVSIL